MRPHPRILVYENALEYVLDKKVEKHLRYVFGPSTIGLSMFTSIPRGRAKFRPTYICTSCLVYILPHPDHQPARQTINRESFSTTSNSRQLDDNNTSTTTETVKRSGGRARRGRLQTAPISHSNNALSSLKESLQDEEQASKAPARRSPAKKLKPKQAAPVSHSKAESSALKESLVAEATASKRPKSKPQGEQKKAAEDAESTKSVEDGKTYPSFEGKPANSKKPLSAKPKKPAKKAPKSTSDTTDAATKDGTTQAEEPKEIENCRTSRKSKPRLHAKSPTDAQRRKVEAVLLGVKNKQAAVLAKKITSHVHAIGENETRETLVKIIEDGKLSNGDKAKAIRKVATMLSAKDLSVQKSRAKKRLGRDGPLVHRFLSDEKSHSRVLDLSPPIRRIRYSDDKVPLIRMYPTGSSRASIESGFADLRSKVMRFKSLKDGMKDRPVRVRLSSPRRSRLTEPAPRTGRSKAGVNIVTGPLEEREGFEIKTLDASDLELTPISKPQPQVPSLWYGLERVLFNPGVYQLQDPRSRIFNFDPYLQTIMPVSEFDFTALKRYVTSSRDETLLATAREEKKKYTGSTSSTTAALAHFHFLLSQWRPVNTETLSKNFPVEYNTFTALQRGPSAVFLKWKDGVYAIDADKQFDSANILSTLGKSMEKLLTLPTEDFEKYRKQNSDQIPMEEREAAEAYNYTTMGDFLLRSQLDAHDPRLPGTGMFDLKTRAVVSIRMDTAEYEQGMDYEIQKRFGEWESYEREYYDMIRAAFLKYSLQVRMGRMDGIFVAFHNTQRIFGFQYISLPEMDLALHGTEDTTTGDSEFKMSLELLNKVLDRATAKYPEKSLRLHFETRGTDVPFMYIFAEPMEDEQIAEIQESNKAVIEEFEKRVLGLGDEEREEGPVEEEEQLSEEEKKAAEWASMRAKVEENMEKDELDIEEARAVVESLIDESVVYNTDIMSAEEKERMINELLESAAFSEDEDEEAIVSRTRREDGENRIEGAIADFEGNEIDEDEDDENEDDEENGEEDEEEREEDEEAEGEEEVKEGGEVEESDCLESTEETGLLDDSPTDSTTVDENAETSELLADAESTEAVDEFQDEPIEDDIESIEEVQDETPKDVDDHSNIQIADPVNAELVENMDLAPNDAAFASDTQVSAPSEESITASDETETSKAEWSDGEGDVEKTTKYEDKTEVLAMTLTIRNKVNGKYVDRPRKLTANDKWTIEYALEDVRTKQKAQKLYQSCKRRRGRALSNAKKDENNPWNDKYLENLRQLSRKGKAWREHQNRIDQEEPVKVLDWDEVKNDADQKASAKDGEKKQ
jgi:hypothetical protein